MDRNTVQDVGPTTNLPGLCGGLLVLVASFLGNEWIHARSLSEIRVLLLDREQHSFLPGLSRAMHRRFKKQKYDYRMTWLRDINVRFRKFQRVPSMHVIPACPGTTYWLDQTVEVLDNLFLQITSKTILERAIYMWMKDEPGCRTVYGEIARWDITMVTDLSRLFQNNRTFNSDISGWDVSNVRTMQSMFMGTTQFNQPLERWDCSCVTSMKQMFCRAHVFDQSLETWDVSNVTTMEAMFAHATAFRRPFTLSSWRYIRNSALRKKKHPSR
jgi:surface protein